MRRSLAHERVARYSTGCTRGTARARCCTASTLSHRARRSARAGRTQRLGPFDARASAIMGLVRCEGDLRFAGRSLERPAAPSKSRGSGSATCPSIATCFPTLTVHENLLGIAPRSAARAALHCRRRVPLFPGAGRTRSATRAARCRAASSRCSRSRGRWSAIRELARHRRTRRRSRAASDAAGRRMSRDAARARRRDAADRTAPRRSRGACERVAVMGHGAIVFDGSVRDARGGDAGVDARIGCPLASSVS